MREINKVRQEQEKQNRDSQVDEEESKRERGRQNILTKRFLQQPSFWRFFTD